MEEDISIGLTNFAREVHEYGTKEARQKWPYYKESVAIAVRDKLDRLHERKVPQRIIADGISVHTLRLQYYQGVHYLLDELDPDGKYRELYNNTKAETKVYEGYIELFVRRRGGIGAAAMLDNDGTWKEQLEEFLTVATPGAKFQRVNIVITDDDKNWIDGLLNPLGELFISKVDNNSVLIIRDTI
jgi:hypothetical protein